ELARSLGIARSTASEHASRLVDGGLLTETRQGRHRYLRLARPEVAEAIESLGAISTASVTPAHSLSVSTRDAALRAGRTCYRHLAGRLGVELLDALRDLGVVTGTWQLGPDGAAWFARLGITPGRARRPLLRPCLDWTERRDHLAGLYADALCDQLLTREWLVRRGTTRAVRLTDLGTTELRRIGVRLSPA
ncbi:MAG: helix-turn-helix transcriptional regulator, partial [Microlunatus sp.]|nr:helix-turn-helix transcriptional regulator [Microlunatus sp.]